MQTALAAGDLETLGPPRAHAQGQQPERRGDGARGDRTRPRGAGARRRRRRCGPQDRRRLGRVRPGRRGARGGARAEAGGRDLARPGPDPAAGRRAGRHGSACTPRTPGGGHVLVVDDSRMNRMTLIRLLERLGHETTEAADGREALDVLAAGTPVDLVLLDLVMPELDGFETLATMKADPRLAAIPVIVVSGLDDLDGIVRCIEMGAVDYLPRPIKPTLLQARVEATLADKRLRDDNARLLATVERQRTELARFLSPAGRGAGVDARRARRSSPAIAARSRSCSRTSGASPRSARPRIPRRSSSCCASITTVVGRRVTEFEATLEHFAGDGVHLFFNDPVEQGDHRLRALRMTVALRGDVARLQARWEAPRRPPRVRGRRVGRACDRRADRLRGPLRVCGRGHDREPRGAAVRRGRRGPDPRDRRAVPRHRATAWRPSGSTACRSRGSATP